MSAVGPPTSRTPDGNVLVLPLLPLRGQVVLPHEIVTMRAGRPGSVRAVENAVRKGRDLMLVAQRDDVVETPGTDDLHRMGVLGRVERVLGISDGAVKFAVTAGPRVRILEFTQTSPFFEVQAKVVATDGEGSRDVQSLAMTLVRSLEARMRSPDRIPVDLAALAGISDRSELADRIAAGLPLSFEGRQQFLELTSLPQRLVNLREFLDR